MGTWGDGPWENDAAADWFGDVVNVTRFADRVVAGLNADVDDSPEIVRAAAHIMFLMGRVYVWPIDRLTRDLQLASDRLDQLLERDWEPVAALRKESRAIKARLKSNRKASAAPRPAAGNSAKGDAQAQPSAASPNSCARKKPVKNSHGTPVLRVAWTRDLATVEQRKNASAHRWGIDPPSITVLESVGENRLLAGTGQHLQLIDTTTGATIRDLAKAEQRYTGISCGAIATRGGLYVVTDADQVFVREPLSGEVVFASKRPARTATTVISPDGRRLLVLTWDGMLHVYDIERKAKLFELKHDPPKRPEDAVCAVSPDGRRAASSWKGSVCFWDLEAGSLIRKHRNKHAGVKFTSDSMAAITRSGTGFVLWDAESGQKVRTITGAIDRMLSDHLISPKQRFVCEVAPFNHDAQQGEICSVRDWVASDAPYTGAGRVDFAWFGTEQIATWRNVVEEGYATCEVRLWTLNPLELVGTASVEPLLLPIENENEPVRAGVQFFRIATAVGDRMIFAGDGNAHVHAFQVST